MKRTLGTRLSRDIALVCLADGIVGASYGAIAVSAGFDLWVPVVLSLVVFAGAAQFLFIGLVAAGASPLAAVVAGLLVNARHLPFGLAIGDVLDPPDGGDAPAGRRPPADRLRAWGRRLVGSHLMIDESVAFALAQDQPARRRAAYWACGIGLFVSWNACVVIGGLAGRVVGDPAALGLDAAFPAVLLALVLPSLRTPGTRRAALVGAAIALAATPVLPAGLPVLLALAGLPLVLRSRGGRDADTEVHT